MIPSRRLVCLFTIASSLCAEVAQAVSCPGGGTLDLSAASDSLSLTPVAATTFNFGEHVILSAQASGFSVAGYAWTIEGPTIKDYNEDLGTMAPPASPMPWSTTPLAASDLSSASPQFYFAPKAAEIFPNNGPFTRSVSLAATKSGGGTCSVSISLTLERNTNNSDRQPEDFYTSNHRSAFATNPGDGHVIDEHQFWHHNVDTPNGPPTWMGFLAWHGLFLNMFNQWRVTFGYPVTVPWYPGRPLPTGPAFDQVASLRNSSPPYNPDSWHVPTYYTIVGGSGDDPNATGTQRKLSDYGSLIAFSNSFEGSFHGYVHCAIGANVGGFFDTDGAGFGSMCKSSSPKDSMFWRWHGFIDVMYRNFCALHPGGCSSPSPADPAADPWMADNSQDVANNGTVPSPGTHWISPDLWNRRAPVTSDACVAPIDAYGNHVTTGGAVRNCGSSSDHENPEAGNTNYLYGTLRNTRPGTHGVVYAEVGVYYALASSGLVYPADFTFIPDSRQFIALQLNAGDTTSVGPIPWQVPPLPPANDHYCLYLRVFSVQETPPTETGNIDSDVANSNSLAWRNIKVVPPGDMSPAAFFIVRNIQKEEGAINLRFELPPALVRAGGAVHFALDETLLRAFEGGHAQLRGLERDREGGFVMTRATKAEIVGLRLAPKQMGHVKVSITGAREVVAGDLTITQLGARGVEGGVTLRLTAGTGKREIGH